MRVVKNTLIVVAIAIPLVILLIAAIIGRVADGQQVGQPQGHVQVRMPAGEGSTVRVTGCRTEDSCAIHYRGAHDKWVLRRR